MAAVCVPSIHLNYKKKADQITTKRTTGCFPYVVFVLFVRGKEKNYVLLPFSSSHSSDSWNHFVAVYGDKIMSDTETFLKHLHYPGRNGCHGVSALSPDKNFPF